MHHIDPSPRCGPLPKREQSEVNPDTKQAVRRKPDGKELGPGLNLISIQWIYGCQSIPL